MTDSLTLNHASRVLATITPELRADAALRKYMGNVNRLGPREKRAVSRAVFTYFRWLLWLDEKASAQKQVEEALKLQERFDKNPQSVKIETLAARAVPTWARNEVDFPAETLRQLQSEPALWLRARPGTAEKLASTLGNCETTPHAPDALRYRGAQDLFLTPAFHNGSFEIQDLASQLVGLACAPKPGETWWDACAGEGGKMLHLADLMQNKGLIWASDRSERRLHTLKQRAARAKVFNFRTALWDGSAKLPTKTKFDGILVDAPCSGIGTWQRNPHARWTTSADDVTELAAVQRLLLENVAGSLKPGGRLVFAVCTLANSETTAIANAFAAAHPELEPIPVLEKSPQLILWPHEYTANGMFLAAWKKK
ncbi:MAG: RsmB/NOP family class I SAM-dependent RNA methyltransferase [Nibricoccus sp.]